MILYLETLELLTTKAVGGQSRALEAVPDVAEVRDPPQVDGDGVEADEEAGEQEERDGHHRCQEHSVLEQQAQS